MGDGNTGGGGRKAADGETSSELVLVARKACFGLPTACPTCLPVYLYLRLANVSFQLHYDGFNPDSDHVPYVEFGDYAALNNENGGVIEKLKEDDIVDLDSKLQNQSMPDWCSTKAIISTWLKDAASYELWVASDGSAANEIYFSDLPWPIRKALHWNQRRVIRNKFELTQTDALEREKEIYRRAGVAYEALSLRLGDQRFFFENRPTSLDAIFLGHALFVLQTSDDTSELRKLLIKHENLVKYAENLKNEFLEPSSSSSMPRSPLDPSTSSTPRGWSSARSSQKPKGRREKTEEEKTFRRKAKYFIAAQLVSVLVFLTIMGGSGKADLDMDDNDEWNE